MCLTILRYWRLKSEAPQLAKKQAKSCPQLATLLEMSLNFSEQSFFSEHILSTAFISKTDLYHAMIETHVNWQQKIF